MSPIIAGTSWPDASIAIFGIILVIAIVWQIFATGRTAISSDGGGQAKRTNDLLEQLTTDVADVRTRLGEVERLLKEV